MRLLRDSMPFGALFGAPLWAIGKELVAPVLAGLVLGAGLAGWLVRGRKR